MLGAGLGLCLLIVLTGSGSPSAQQHSSLAAKRDAAVVKPTPHVEGTPSAADVRRARVPYGQRERRLRAHPYYALYKAARRRYGVSWYLVASMHYQETGYRRARARARTRQSARSRKAGRAGPARVRRRDFNRVMSIAAELRKRHARGLGARARRAALRRYGRDADGRLSTAMVIERARSWKLLGVIPMPGSGELATPVKGTVGGCGYFGCPRPGHLHNGIDFLARGGTPVHAAEAGRVASIQSPGQSGGYGNFVCVQHRPHLATCYAHLSAFAPRLKVGRRVKRGQILGLVGSTGHSTAPHLHFEVRRGVASCQPCAVDPMPLLDGKAPQDTVRELVKRQRRDRARRPSPPRHRRTCSPRRPHPSRRPHRLRPRRTSPRSRRRTKAAEPLPRPR